MTTLEKLEQLVCYGIKESFKESGRETDQMMKESARQLDELKLQMRDLTKSLGLFAESMVYPATIPLFRERGIVLTGVSSRLREQRNGGMMEVDVLGTGPEAIVVVEAKLRFDLAMVKDFLKRLPDFFKYFPRYAGPKLYGAVAGMSVEQGVTRFAYKQGLFVLMLAGDNMVIWNEDKFQPRVFSATSKQAGKKK